MQDAVDVSVKRVHGGAPVQRRIRRGKPASQGPTRPLRRQGLAHPLGARLQRKVVSIELEHRYPQIGAPLETENFASIYQLGQTGRITHLVFDKQALDNASWRRAAGLNRTGFRGGLLA